MTATLEQRLADVFAMTDDLVGVLSELDLERDLGAHSNTIWDQLWCVVGARESMVAAIEAGEWDGFRCSLRSSDRNSAKRMREALEASRVSVAAYAIDADTSGPLLDLLLHETQHHGQLIRYMYGLGIEFPNSWKARWSL